MDHTLQWQMEKSPQADAPHCEHVLQWTLTHSRGKITLPNYLGRYVCSTRRQSGGVWCSDACQVWACLGAH